MASKKENGVFTDPMQSRLDYKKSQPLINFMHWIQKYKIAKSLHNLISFAFIKQSNHSILTYQEKNQRVFPVKILLINDLLVQLLY